LPNCRLSRDFLVWLRCPTWTRSKRTFKKRSSAVSDCHK
jgi:hypothetical protein